MTERSHIQMLNGRLKMSQNREGYVTRLTEEVFVKKVKFSLSMLYCKTSQYEIKLN